MRLLREQLAGLMSGDGQHETPPREKVLEPLSLEGVATHIQKIRNSDDSA